MTIRTLIVDDEPLARERLRVLLRAEPDVEIAGECATGQEAVAAIARDAADLVFLDVQMPGLDGFGVLEAVGPSRMPSVVFVTAYDEHAVRAFEVNALDYLLKPFDDERFARTMSRARREVAGRDAAASRIADPKLVSLLGRLQEGGRPAERLVVKSSGRVLLLRTEEVDWVEATGNYVCLHVGRESHLMRETLGGLERRLDPARFLRIHRSTLVNIDRVKALRPFFHGDHVVELHDGTQLKLRRAYHERLEKLLGRAL